MKDNCHQDIKLNTANLLAKAKIVEKTSYSKLFDAYNNLSAANTSKLRKAVETAQYEHYETQKKVEYLEKLYSWY